MEQQNQHSIQEKTEIKPPIKTNWKFVATFLFLSVVAGGIVGYYFLTQKPEQQKVEKVVYTRAAWDGDVGRVRRLIVANKDRTGRKILLEKIPNEHLGISSSILLIPERNEVVVVTQGRFYPYDIDVEKINTETGQRSKLAMYKEGGIHGMSLLSVILSPDKKKIAFTIRKHLFIVDVTKEKLVALKPFYTETQLRDGDSIAPAFWDSLDNIYLKSFEGKPEENRIKDFIKVSFQGKREELSSEQKTFFKAPSRELHAVDFHLYPSPDGKFAAWIISPSKQGAFPQKILVYSVEKRWWFIRLKKDSIQTWENEEAINFQKERLDSPLNNVEVKERTKGDISNAQLYIDGMLIDSIPDYKDYGAVGMGHGKAFEILAFVSGAPITGWEKDWYEKAIEQKESELREFKQSALYPTYLPPGWVEKNESGDKLGSALTFENSKGGTFVIQQQKKDAQIPQGFIAIRDYISQYPKDLITAQESIIIGTRRGLYFTVSGSKQILTWSTEGLDVAVSCFDSEGCSLEKEELIKIANSIKPVTTLQQGLKQAESTAGWQTYRNDEFAFEVKYPSGWRSKDTPGLGLEYLASPGSKIVGFSVDGFPYEKSLNDYFDEERINLETAEGANYILSDVKETVVGGHRAIEIPYWSGTRDYTSKLIFVKYEGFVYRLDVPGKWVGEEGTKIFEQILSTFRFTPTQKPVDTGVAREITITAKKNQWRFMPEEFEVNQGDKVVLTVVNEDDYDHGFAIDQFGISQRIPGNSIIKVEFTATQAGDFPFYSSVPSGGGIVDGKKRTYYDMVGKMHVRSLIPETK